LHNLFWKFSNTESKQKKENDSNSQSADFDWIQMNERQQKLKWFHRNTLQQRAEQFQQIPLLSSDVDDSASLEECKHQRRQLNKRNINAENGSQERNQSIYSISDQVSEIFQIPNRRKKSTKTTNLSTNLCHASPNVTIKVDQQQTDNLQSPTQIGTVAQTKLPSCRKRGRPQKTNQQNKTSKQNKVDKQTKPSGRQSEPPKQATGVADVPLPKLMSHRTATAPTRTPRYLQSKFTQSGNMATDDKINVMSKYLQEQVQPHQNVFNQLDEIDMFLTQRKDVTGSNFPMNYQHRLAELKLSKVKEISGSPPTQQKQNNRNFSSNSTIAQYDIIVTDDDQQQNTECINLMSPVSQAFL